MTVATSLHLNSTNQKADITWQPVAL